MPRMTDEQREQLKNRLVAGEKRTKLAKDFNVTWDTVNSYYEELVAAGQIKVPNGETPRLERYDARAILEAIVQTHEAAMNADTRIKALEADNKAKDTEIDTLHKQKAALEEEVRVLRNKVNEITDLERRLELARQQVTAT